MCTDQYKLIRLKTHIGVRKRKEILQKCIFILLFKEFMLNFEHECQVSKIFKISFSFGFVIPFAAVVENYYVRFYIRFTALWQKYVSFFISIFTLFCQHNLNIWMFGNTLFYISIMSSTTLVTIIVHIWMCFDYVPLRIVSIVLCNHFGYNLINVWMPFQVLW